MDRNRSHPAAGPGDTSWQHPDRIAGLKSAGMMFGQCTGSDLFNRLFVLGGMITGLMVSAIAIMTLTLAVSGISAGFLKRSSLVALQAKPDTEE